MYPFMLVLYSKKNKGSNLVLLVGEVLSKEEN